jgi:hypothetical protein
MYYTDTVNLKKQRVRQLIKKFTTTYGTRRFINIFTKASHGTVPQAT